MKLSLLVMTPGKQEGKALEIKLSQFVIGRDPQCHLRPASPLISKRHCALIQRDGKAFLRDFDSTNGTIRNDEPVKGEVELRHGDVLKVGPITLKVQLEADAPVNRATPAPPTKGVVKKTEDKKDRTPLPDTRAAARAPAASSSDSEEGGDEADDDIAAMLLSVGDDDEPSSGGAEGVPEGTTVMDLPVPPELLAQDSSRAEDKPKEQQPKPATGNTSSAAKAILEKYMRRPRG